MSTIAQKEALVTMAEENPKMIGKIVHAVTLYEDSLKELSASLRVPNPHRIGMTDAKKATEETREEDKSHE